MTTQPKRALIVINVQREFTTGQMPIEFPPLSVSLHNIGRAIDHAAAHAIPVIVAAAVLPENAPVFQRGTEAVELHEVITSRKRDLLIEKTLPSVFAEVDLAAWLRERGVDTVTVAGFASNNCVESTVRDAIHRGFQAELLSDATGTFAQANRAGAVTAEEMQRSVCVSIQSRYGAVSTTEEWLGAVIAGVPLPRDTPVISRQNAQELAHPRDTAIAEPTH